MTSYQGGKQRLGKKIYNVMKDWEKKLCKDTLPYLEPFCGMWKNHITKLYIEKLFLFKDESQNIYFDRIKC